MNKFTTFKVEGKGEFPFDMLRYACAWPRSSADAFKLSMREPSNCRTINLDTDRGDRFGISHRVIKRFRSYGWNVIEIDGETDEVLLERLRN